MKTAFSVKRIAEHFVNYRLSDQSADYNREVNIYNTLIECESKRGAPSAVLHLTEDERK